MTAPPPAPARLLSVATAFPEHVADKATAVDGLLRLFPEEDPAFVRALVERSGNERRHTALPVERLLAARDFTARQTEYRAVAETLTLEAARTALARAAITPADVDVVIDCSCTGVMLPALDVALSNALGLRPDVRRLPITESGCAAGALATGFAADFAARGATVLVVAVELCTLSLVREDRTRTNLVAGVLFGDGAAAAVVAPRGTGPAILAAGSHLFPGTRDVMGFDVGTHGLRLILQRELPFILERGLKPAIDAFLARHGMTAADVGLHLVHPGGRRVLETYADLFTLKADDLRYSWEALRTYGNLSSAAILSVLELAVADRALPRDGKPTFLISFGPGLSAEMLLLGDAP